MNDTEASCLKCKKDGLKKNMFQDDTGYICVKCYNPYLYKIMLKPFLNKLPGTFLYPLLGNNRIMLVTGSVFFIILQSFGRFCPSVLSFIAAALISGFLFEYLMSIVLTTVNDNDELPDWPEFGLNSFISPLTKLSTVFFVSFLPLILCYLLYTQINSVNLFEGLILLYVSPDIFSLILLLVLIPCLFYLPMAIASISMVYSVLDGLFQISPHIIISLIRKGPVEYLISCAVLLFAVIMGYIIKLAFSLSIPYLGAIIAIPFTFYFSIVQMRIIGMVYKRNFIKLENERKIKELMQ